MEQIPINVLLHPSGWYSFFVDQLQNNDVFAGFFVLSAMGALAYGGRKLFNLSVLFAKRFLLVELTVVSEDPTFVHLKRFLSESEYIQKKCRRVTMSSGNQTEGGICVGSDEDEGPDGVPRIVLSPAMGTHILWYKNTPILYSRTQDENQGAARYRRETIKMTYFGRSRDLMYDIISEVEKRRIKIEGIRIHSARENYWVESTIRELRRMDTIFLPEEQKARISSDLKKFMENRQWYEDRGIPYHRGYLFSGAGGLGKTSMIHALCSQEHMNIALLNLSAVKGDDSLMSLISGLPHRTAIVIEDIDACVVSHDREKSEEMSKDFETVTLTGLLNALDGITTPSGMVVFMTTNYPEKLDKALIRKGRVDLHEEFCYPTAEIIGKMFDKYFGEEPQKRMEFIKNNENKNISIADLQNQLFEMSNE